MGKLALAAAFVLAGSSVVAAGSVSDVLPPFTITVMSLLFAVMTAAFLCGRDLLRTALRLDRPRWTTLVLQSFFGIFLFRIFLTFGLLHTSAAEAGILTGSAPAWTALLAYCILGDQFTLRRAAGVGLTVLGILVMQGAFSGGEGFDRGHLFGNALALAAMCCEALFTVLARRLHRTATAEQEPIRPVVQTGLVSVIAFLLCLAPAALEQPWDRLAALSAAGWGALVWYGTLVTVVAFACMFYGAKHCDGYTIAAFSGLIPVSSLLLSIAILGETVVPRQWLGCVCIVAAILVINERGEKRNERHGSRQA